MCFKIANYYLQNDMKMIYDIISYHYFNLDQEVLDFTDCQKFHQFSKTRLFSKTVKHQENEKVPRDKNGRKKFIN
jgi:hypothetical protein